MHTLGEIARLLNCSCPAEAEKHSIIGVETLADAQADHLTFVGSDKYVPQLQFTKAAAAIVQRRIKVPPEWEARCLRVDDADLAVANVLQLFAPPIPRPPAGIESIPPLTSARMSQSGHL